MDGLGTSRVRTGRRRPDSATPARRHVHRPAVSRADGGAGAGHGPPRRGDAAGPRRPGRSRRRQHGAGRSAGGGGGSRARVRRRRRSQPGRQRRPRDGGVGCIHLSADPARSELLSCRRITCPPRPRRAGKGDGPLAVLGDAEDGRRHAEGQPAARGPAGRAGRRPAPQRPAGDSAVAPFGYLNHYGRSGPAAVRSRRPRLGGAPGKSGDGGVTADERRTLDASADITVVTIPGPSSFTPNEEPPLVANLVLEALRPTA